jgi:hypothetical protein
MSKFVQKFRKDRDYDSDFSRNEQRQKQIREQRKAASSNKRDWDTTQEDNENHSQRRYR